MSGYNVVVIDAVLQESVVQGRPFQIPYLGITTAEETCSQETQDQKQKPVLSNFSVFPLFTNIITTISLFRH